MGVSDYALEFLARERLDELRRQAAVLRLAWARPTRTISPLASPPRRRLGSHRFQGWLRRAMTASIWHLRQPYAVRPRTPGASSAAS